jgi:type 1 glutamine amidotransferase
MKNLLLAFTAFLVTALSISAADSPKALRALLITGGCCHDYGNQKKILSEGISGRANVEWTVVQDPSTGTKGRPEAYQKENWAQGFDVVVHNECFSDEKDLDWLERIVKPHREGVPAVVIHCAMHCYRAPTNEWFKFVGVTSHRHGSHFAYLMKNVKPEHPIMQGFPATWQTPREELYNIASVGEKTIPLATGYSHETKTDEVNVWVNTYGKGRVFGTTIGHYNHTMEKPEFLDLITRGLLWSCGKLGPDGKPLPGYGAAAK